MHDLIFWMVWREGGKSPTCRHPSYESAETEAKRLAQNFPGVDFYILEARRRIRLGSFEIATLTDCPF